MWHVWGGSSASQCCFGIGALCLIYQLTSLLVIVPLRAGFALGWICSIVIDGTPAVLFLGVLCAEIVFATVAVRVPRLESISSRAVQA